MTNHFIARALVSAMALAMATGAAQAQAEAKTPTFYGDPLIAIGILVALILIVWFLIRGSLGIAARDKSDDDAAGVGILEGIDEDEDRPKRR